MKFLSVSKDGGAESTVWAYWLCEIKSLFSVAMLRFEDGSRDAYHSHAFDCVSWVLSGHLTEVRVGWDTPGMYEHAPSWRPLVTRRTHLHKVVSRGRTWVLTFRGPWARKWLEYSSTRGFETLTHGRRVVGSEPS